MPSIALRTFHEKVGDEKKVRGSSPPGTLLVLCQRDLQTAAYPEAFKCLTAKHLVHPPLHSLSPCETHVKSMSYSMVSTNIFTSVTSYLSTADPSAAVVNACSETYVCL